MVLDGSQFFSTLGAGNRQELTRNEVHSSLWAKDPRMDELRQYQQANMSKTLRTCQLALFTRVLGWDVEEVRLLMVFRKDLMDRSTHVYTWLYLVYGQKETKNPQVRRGQTAEICM
ncbi:hypothetical protein BDV59DRAFT_189257, partial [Aspergillus ambiguus]|uniref:uncharacterized protein n=1 Tax=Aspergillus ambiguus TaxID=176160 RepID=UPI003CCE49BC